MSPFFWTDPRILGVVHALYIGTYDYFLCRRPALTVNTTSILTLTRTRMCQGSQNLADDDDHRDPMMAFLQPSLQYGTAVLGAAAGTAPGMHTAQQNRGESKQSSAALFGVAIAKRCCTRSPCARAFQGSQAFTGLTSSEAPLSDCWRVLGSPKSVVLVQGSTSQRAGSRHPPSTSPPRARLRPPRHQG